MKIKVYDYMTTYTDNYKAIPEPIKAKLARLFITLLHDNKQKRYTAALCDEKTLLAYERNDRYKMVYVEHPSTFVKNLDANLSNIKNNLKHPDYTSLDTLDGAWLVGYELLRLKILSLAGEQV